MSEIPRKIETIQFKLILRVKGKIIRINLLYGMCVF